MAEFAFVEVVDRRHQYPTKGRDSVFPSCSCSGQTDLKSCKLVSVDARMSLEECTGSMRLPHLNPPSSNCPSCIDPCRNDYPIQQKPQLSDTKLKVVVLILLLRVASTNFLAVQAKANEVEIDWSVDSHLFNKGDRLTTKYIRMKDILHFRCPPFISFNIHMVAPESALFCRLPLAEEVLFPSPRATPILRTPIGRCAPNTGDPKVNVRPFSPLPDRPVFQEGNSYFLITTSTGTADGVENREGGLCESHGMRLRLVVLSGPGVVHAGSRVGDEDVTSLVDIFHHLKSAHLSTASTITTTATAPTTTTPSPPVTEPNVREDEEEEKGGRGGKYEEDLQDLPEHAPTTTTSTPGTEEQRRRNPNRSKLSPRDHRLSSSTTTMSVVEQQQPNSPRHVDGEGGFPAVLTLEENGRKKKILVHNSRQLQQEINYANERNSRVQQLEVFKSSEEDRSGGGSIRPLNLPEYSITGRGEIQAIPAKLSPSSTIDAGSGSMSSVNTAGLGRREAGSHHVQGRGGLPHQTNQEAGETSMQHRQLPFIYVVGYNEDGTEQHLPSTAASRWTDRPLSVLTTLCFSLVPSILCSMLNLLFLRDWR